MFWRVMQLQLAGNTPCLGRLECFVERRDLMSVEIVQPHTNHLGFGVADVHQPLHFMGKVHLGALLCHMHVPFAGLRFNKEKETDFSVVLFRPNFMLASEGYPLKAHKNQWLSTLLSPPSSLVEPRTRAHTYGV